jgi:hypothetical protein
MRTLLSLLLIPFFVLGQVLPHSHAGTGVNEPDDHAVRPHVHLSIGHSHHHHDGSDHHHADVVSEALVAVACLSPRVDHNSDAIYLVPSTSTVGRVSTALSICVASFPAINDCWGYQPVVALTRRFGVAYQRYDGLPIYLLVASLRL